MCFLSTFTNPTAERNSDKESLQAIPRSLCRYSVIGEGTFLHGSRFPRTRANGFLDALCPDEKRSFAETHLPRAFSCECLNANTRDILVCLSGLCYVEPRFGEVR